jgi:hypothetical protein
MGNYGWTRLSYFLPHNYFSSIQFERDGMLPLWLCTADRNSKTLNLNLNEGSEKWQRVEGYIRTDTDICLGSEEYDISYEFMFSIKTFQVSCIHEVTRGNTVTVPNTQCPHPVPRTERLCNAINCPPYWEPGDWGRVSEENNLYILLKIHRSHVFFQFISPLFFFHGHILKNTVY